MGDVTGLEGGVLVVVVVVGGAAGGYKVMYACAQISILRSHHVYSIHTFVGVATGLAGGVGVDDWIGFDDAVLWLLTGVVVDVVAALFASAAAAAAAFCSSACCCNFARRFNRICIVVRRIRGM